MYVNYVVEKHSCYEKCFSNMYPFVFIPINWAILVSDSELQFLFLSNGGNRVIVKFPSSTNIITLHDFSSFC